MRIVAGQARGHRLASPVGEDTRPTLERVKEGMFSAVQNWLPGAVVLDLFAGSGQLGLEAVSRGAARCVFVEGNRRAADVVAQNIEASGLGAQCSLVKTSAEAFMVRNVEKFDLVLLDPPFEAGFYASGLAKVATLCAPGARVLCESLRGADMLDEAAGLVLEKQYRYGTVMVSRYLLREETGD